MKNQLSQSYSPYLLQHAKNPVFWHIWKDSNLLKARTENKLMIISIGYAACHWCHVMEKECFEDVEVAQVMNLNYYSFKIDREELPAVDAYYMQALQIMTKQGGWPLNIVALPNGLPVWGATYVPKEQWIDVLQQLSSLYKEDPEKMYDYAEKLNNGIALANNTLEIYPANTSEWDFAPLLENWKKSFDPEYGGYLRAPKFMMPTNLNFLHRYGVVNQLPELTEHVYLTLTKMAYGGLFDVAEGGFSRYSTDHQWHIPHFEKMLYDNAQLLSTYSSAYLESGNELFKDVLIKTTQFILDRWPDPSGGFYTAFDADSLNEKQQLEEGAYYTWTEAQLKELIPQEEWYLFSDIFSINSQNIWEETGSYVLFQKEDPEKLALQHMMEVKQLHLLKKHWESTLLKARQNKALPLLDDKILISWNALLLSGLLDARKIFHSQELDKAIMKLSTFLSNKAFHSNMLGRAFKNDEVYLNGILEDYAFTIKAFIELFNSSQKIDHLQFAKELTFLAIDLFFDEKQGFFRSEQQTDSVPIFEIEDNVIPSSNAIMSRNLFYIGFLYANDYLMNISRQMTQIVLCQINYASAFSEWLINDLIYHQDFEYAVVKNPSEEELRMLNEYGNYKIVLDNSLNIPILASYKKQKKKLQVCTLTSCRLETDNINEILE